MLDFNHQRNLSEQVSALLDTALQAAEARATPPYLGASRLGVACARALQYEYAQAPVDPGRDFSGQLLRIFRRGHVVEDCMSDVAAGRRVRPPHQQSRLASQFGFSLLDGKLQGHVDGVICRWPGGFAYPCLWENKCLNTSPGATWRSTVWRSPSPIYAAQVAMYQAYLQLHEHPALFTAVNADTMAIYAEAVPFDGGLGAALIGSGREPYHRHRGRRTATTRVHWRRPISSAAAAAGRTAAGGNRHDAAELTSHHRLR